MGGVQGGCVGGPGLGSRKGVSGVRRGWGGGWEELMGLPVAG